MKAFDWAQNKFNIDKKSLGIVGIKAQFSISHTYKNITLKKMEFAQILLGALILIVNQNLE